MNSLRLFLLALWLGAALFFSVNVAPAVFSVLRSFQLANASEIAGTIVTRTLAVVNLSGFAISLFLLVTAFLFKRPASEAAFSVETILLALVAIPATVVTVIVPVFARAGTCAWIRVWAGAENVEAATPPNLTAVTLVKLTP